MVLAGQFLERPALVRGEGGLVLEGLFHRGRRRPALLLCPAPGPGGGMDAPVVAELAWAAARAGHASLRFQYRGVGASQGTPDPARAIEDAVAAHAHLEETVRAAPAIAGVGAGCEIALELLERITGCPAVVLVAPGRPPAAIPPAVRARARLLAILPGRAAAGAAELEATLRGQGEVVLVEGADTLFLTGLPRVGKAAVDFLGRGA